MKKLTHTMREYYQYWRSLMRSKYRSMSCGASHIARIISYPNKDNWRRKETKK